MLARIDSALSARASQVVLALLRLALGFAFVPAGLKKVLGQPFTDADRHGVFHDFLHAFYDTGGFYRFVGAMQLLVAGLLMSQRHTALGVALGAPILTAILVFCWSTEVYPTAVVVSLMGLGLLALGLSERARFSALWASRPVAWPKPEALPIDLRLWRRCGASLAIAYLLVSLAHGGVYRPRGLDWRAPSFYVFPAMLAFLVLTFVVDQRRYRRRAAR